MKEFEMNKQETKSLKIGIEYNLYLYLGILHF